MQELIELWLTETRSRSFYEGADVRERLGKYASMLDDNPLQAMVVGEILDTPENEKVSSQHVQDFLLDLYGELKRALATV